MLVTVEDGRAVKVAGDPDHPVTAGTLCAKVNDYVERVYAPDRLARPLVRDGPKGSGQFREATWDAAIELVTRASRRGARRVRGRSDPSLLLSRHDGIPPARSHERARDERASAPPISSARSVPMPASRASIATHGLSPEVDPERWVNARYVIVWAWNPLSTAPHLWRFILEARKRTAPSWWSSIRSGVAPRVSPTSTCGPCPAPMAPSPWA